jgi:hypothetical protein
MHAPTQLATGVTISHDLHRCMQNAAEEAYKQSKHLQPTACSQGAPSTRTAHTCTIALTFCCSLSSFAASPLLQ